MAQGASRCPSADRPHSTAAATQTQKKKALRPFDWSKHSLEKVCVRFAYVGTNYHGLAFQSKENQPTIAATVEEMLFQSLDKTRLWKGITHPETCYSRCGRTDKGVHAAGNYFSCNMRKLGTTDDRVDFRIKMLNGVLPKDIRILRIHTTCAQTGGPLSPAFDARFSCLFRTYRYFFVVRPEMKTSYLDAMRRASQLLVGEHDFRNFCKMDLDQTTNFTRRILHVRWLEGAADEMENTVPGVQAVEICGISFLWHQIRCIMEVLFLVAEGKEQVGIVRELLDIEKNPQKPNYDLADERGLVLYDCGFAEFGAGAAAASSSSSSMTMTGNHALTNNVFSSVKRTGSENADAGASCVLETRRDSRTSSASSPSRAAAAAGAAESFSSAATPICPSSCVPLHEQAIALQRDLAVLRCLEEASGYWTGNGHHDETNGHHTQHQQKKNGAIQLYTPLMQRSKAPSLEEKLVDFERKNKGMKKRDCSTLVNDRDDEKFAKMQKIGGKRRNAAANYGATDVLGREAEAGG
mmetsp:Transcript_10644/g.26037  ORF Transcript_10644/g.26037 Transcript_10644/m.26037 type:complete len:523 (-) Transcript_10644:173-1741(-)|eukprot:CAMPEP_0178985230 /NCGR_PEP_ID=MMETSP0795-20121207/2038_1 /TAXON_ID=88552 /ORGANISM="Amoebophrya sp., Strain Ameob2" /LENGTH=522 /DNA_ID=CAMNT_0020676167 /DNA_START=123 /DNA_END=1694 /DNA_ORIENTATION=+